MVAIFRRLFRSNSSPETQLSKLEWANFVFLKDLSSQIVFVCSYPRSGDTWLRCLMADCLLQKAGYECSTDLPIHPDKLIPDIHCHDLRDIVGVRHITNQSFYKTHFSPWEASRYLGDTPQLDAKYIYLYRSPEDALLSFYYFKLRYPGSSNVAEQGPDAFCTDELKHWVHHLSKAMLTKERNENVCLARYEDLHLATSKSLLEICDWLEIDMPAEACIQAAKHMEFANLQQREARSSSNSSGHRFFRKGQIGSAEKELKQETIELIRSKSRDLLSRADRVRLKALPVSEGQAQ